MGVLLLASALLLLLAQYIQYTFTFSTNYLTCVNVLNLASIASIPSVLLDALFRTFLPVDSLSPTVFIDSLFKFFYSIIGIQIIFAFMMLISKKGKFRCVYAIIFEIVFITFHLYMLYIQSQISAILSGTMGIVSIGFTVWFYLNISISALSIVILYILHHILKKTSAVKTNNSKNVPTIQKQKA